MVEGFYAVETDYHPEFRGDTIDARPWWPIFGDWDDAPPEGVERIGTAHRAGDRWFLDWGRDELGNALPDC